MATGRTLRSLLSRRRRGENEEDEDEDGPVVVADSQSEGSGLSEAGDEGDEGDASSVGDPVGVDPPTAQTKSDISPVESKSKRPRKPRKHSSTKSPEAPAEIPQSQDNFKAMADTEAMMNGLGISDGTQTKEEEAVDFEQMESSTAVVPNHVTANGNGIAVNERQRREQHEEYRRKRDSNPAFIPTRGNFFMHDTRGQANRQPQRSQGPFPGKPRARAGMNVGGPYSPPNQMARAERAAEQTWKHDLHDTINEEPPSNAKAAAELAIPANNMSRDVPSKAQAQPRALNFSMERVLGLVQIHVSFPGMKTSSTFPNIKWKQYTRLPDHRPPLRRDKAVQVLIPGRTPKPAFPQTERSFVFIPRQNRPNQQGFQRGSYQRSIGGYGYSSRRTSMYGGSIYSNSVAPSRRSSFVGREQAFSPAGSMMGMPSARPIVRLPHGGQPFSGMSTPIGPFSGHQTPTGIPPMHSYPPPQPPTHFGTPTDDFHHPRPQKAISVTGIESPMLQQEPQAFRNQLPPHMHEPPPPYFSPQHGFPQHSAPGGTPLSGIPEQAVHAAAFQPSDFNQPHYYAAYPPPSNYYYPPPPPSANGYPQMPMYMMPPQAPYMGPPPAHEMTHQQPPPPPERPTEVPSAPTPQTPQHSQPQSGMVAHESNGMVFYVPASEAQQSDHYQPAESFVPSYAMPGLPPPTPAPEHYYSQMQGGMQEVGSGVYYPAGLQQ